MQVVFIVLVGVLLAGVSNRREQRRAAQGLSRRSLMRQVLEGLQFIEPPDDEAEPRPRPRPGASTGRISNPPPAGRGDERARRSSNTLPSTRLGRGTIDVARALGNDLISKVLPALQQTSRYVIITGGGVLLLHDLLIKSVETVGKQQPQDYLVVNHGLAAILNSVGALFAVLFMLAAKRG